MALKDTYHVMLGKRRTTVSMDKIISILLALKLDCVPETEDAHGVVRAYLQEKLENPKDPGRIMVSQWLREESILDLVDKHLSKKYSKWFSEDYDLKNKKGN